MVRRQLVTSGKPKSEMLYVSKMIRRQLFLNASQESEAAQKGLEYVVSLMAVYEWHEKTYLVEESMSNLRKQVVDLYVLLLEYQTKLLVHMHKRAPAQWAGAVFNTGEWISRTKDIEEHDTQCKALINAIANARTVEWRNEERMWQEQLLQQPRRDEENRHIRMLYSNYEQGKNFNPERIAGTCEWFLKHSAFLTWRKAKKSSILWLSADPGCGKSVLSRYLVDRRGELLTLSSQAPIICYFFFKDGDVDRASADKALCAILHQLIMQEPELYKYAEDDFSKKNESFLGDSNALWYVIIELLPLFREGFNILGCIPVAHKSVLWVQSLLDVFGNQAYL